MKRIMTANRYIGKLITIKYSDRPTPYSGFVVDVSDEWTLLKHNPVDYVMDGYVLLRHKNVEYFQRGNKELFAEKVIKSKKEERVDLKIFPVNDLGQILRHLSKTFGCFSFTLKSEKALYLGKLKSITSSRLIIDYINPRAVWSKQMSFRPGDIRTIEFESDYVKSLLNYSKSRKK